MAVLADSTKMLSSTSPRVQLIQSYFDVITLSLGPVGDGADVILDDLDSIDNLLLRNRSFHLGDIVSVMVGVNVDRVRILGDVGLADHLLHGIDYYLRSCSAHSVDTSKTWTEMLRCQEDLMRRQRTEMV